MNKFILNNWTCHIRLAFWIALAVLFFQTSLAFPAETGETKAPQIKGSMSLKTISRESGIPIAYFIESLKLPTDVPLNVPLKNLKDQYGFSMEALRKLAADYQVSGKPRAPSAGQGPGKEAGRDQEKRGETGLPLILYGILCLAVLLLLRAKRLPNRSAIWILAPSLLIFGVFCRANPEPIRAVVQLFQSLAFGKYLWAPLLLFLVFIIMALIGVKLICGWGCPVGTLQELLYRLPVFNRMKKRRIPFWLSNGIRAAILVLFFILLFGFISGVQDKSLYRYFNPFKLFEWDFKVTAPIFVVIIFGLSLLSYRPYCMFVCPFGLFSWIFQRWSVFRVKVNRDSCLVCGKCGRACPTEAAKGILQGKTFISDCFSCARCLNACPNDSLAYKAF